MKLYCATSNPGKLREFRLAAAEGWEFIPLTGIPPCEETGSTFEENAIEKAVYYSGHAPGLLFAEDSGLEVDALAAPWSPLGALRRRGGNRRRQQSPPARQAARRERPRGALRLRHRFARWRRQLPLVPRRSRGPHSGGASRRRRVRATIRCSITRSLAAHSRKSLPNASLQ